MKVRLISLEHLNELVLRAGYSRRAFANSIGISESTMTMLINGNRNPSPKIAKKISDKLEIKFDEVFYVE